MSHDNHKNHTNYNKISTTPAVVEQTKVDTTPAIDVIDNTPPAPIEPIDGIVSGCKRLNVRKEASLTGEIVCEVAVGTTLMIDQSESTDEWFKVYAETGVEGYCMKNFVTINS